MSGFRWSSLQDLFAIQEKMNRLFEETINRSEFADEGLDATLWHVYSVDWTRDAIQFRVDDAVIYRVSRATVEKHGRWAYDNPKYLIANLALGGNYPYALNRTDAPYRGLPAATVDAIKGGRARLLVDWVRVTARGE